jgi:hypothetical protein
MTGHAFFVFNWLQDVNIARPLVYLAARDLGVPVTLLVAQDFIHRDKLGIWREEIEAMRQALDLRVTIFEQLWDAAAAMQGKTGMLVAASESSLSAHALTHDLMRMAPAGIVTITLQHGFECVGFRQSRDHVRAHGLGVTFAADIVCGWYEAPRHTAMTPSQKPKLAVTGPPFVLQSFTGAPPASGPRLGLVCENLHTERLNSHGDLKSDFISTFTTFCKAMDQQFREVVLRPHPGGQYVLKNRLDLPGNVIINNSPIYKLDLRRYAWGISAPSSIIIDMVLAGIPVAVWTDPGGRIDAGNYRGLATVTTVEDWVDFSRRAVAEPESFLEQQDAFIARQLMPIDPADVHARFAAVLGRALRPR